MPPDSATIGKHERQLRLFSFLKDRLSSGARFTVTEAAEATGYKPVSIRTYFSKKLHAYLGPVDGSRTEYHVAAPLPETEDDYLALMTQRAEAPPTPEENMVASLLERSRDAFAVAVESYNRPSLTNRVEVFTILISNAWELLLKAEILDDTGRMDAIFYPDDPKRSISLRSALKTAFPNDGDPVRKNIESIAELRDHAVHLLIPELQPHWSRLFQATVLNFVKRHDTLADREIFGDGAGGLLSLIVDREAAEMAVIRVKFGDDAADEVEGFLDRFLATEEELSAEEFAIPIDYRLVLTNNAKHGDIVLSHGEGGRSAVKVVAAKNIDVTHPHRPHQVLERVRQRAQKSRQRITWPRLRAACWKENIYKNSGSRYYARISNPDTDRFSDALVDLLVEKIQRDEAYLDRAWESYRRFKDS